MGAAGPSPTLSGEAVTSNTFTEVGSGTLTVSEEAATAEFNIYPFESRITLTVSGGTSQEYPDEYIEVRPNEETLNGTLDESRTYDYSFYTGGFEEFDFGTVAVRQGAGFSDTDGVTFDSTDTNVNSFADADQVTAEAFGEISQTPASYEDWGQIVADVRYGKLSTKATSVNAQNKAYDKFIRDYVGETAQLVKQSGLSERNTFAWEGSGTITAQGQLGLGQAPQHTVFGEEGQFTFNGSAEESFTPKGIEGTGLIVKGSALQNLSLAKESVVQNCSSQDLQKDSNLLTSHQQQVQHIPSVVLHPISHSYPITMVQNSSLLVVRSLRTSLLIGDRLFKEMELLLLLITVRSLRLQFQKISTMDLYVWLPSESRGLQVHYSWIQVRRDSWGIHGSILQIFLSRYWNILPLRLCRCSKHIRLRIFWYYWYCHLQGGINIFGANWFSQAPQHTVFGLEGSFTIQGSGAESITPTTEIGSGSLFTIGGISETTAVNPPAAGTKFISGSAKVNPVPAPKGSGTITISQGREEGQTYLRIIDVGTTFGLFGITGSSIEKNTEHYNRSSIKYGQENENFGQIFGTDPSFGFDLQYKGIQSSSVEDYSEGTLTFDNSDQIGRTYDEAVGGAGVLPTFDKTNQYNVNFSSTVVSEDWGEIEDNANTVGGPSYDQELYPYNTGFIDQRGIDAGYFDYGWINEDTQDPPKVPFEPPARIIDAVPRAKTMWIPSFPGSGTVLFDISSATESITVFERADVPLLPLSGSGDEAVVWQSPERTVTILTSGTATESLTKVDVGIGTLATITGELVERVRFEEVGSGTISLVGIATEKLISNPPEGTSLFTPYGSYSNFSAAYSEVADKAVLRLSGELVHPDIDYTPHYGIDRNIGIETGFTLSSGGGLNEDGTGPGIVTTRFIPDYPAAGTIFIEGKAIGRTNAPILTDGTIYILGIGTEANGVIDDDTGIGDLNGVEFGAKERFVPATIEAGPGLFDFTGTAPNRPISVFGYYGDDRDPGTSGTITISTETDQTLYREVTRAAVSAGIGTFSGTLDFRKTNAYDGSGSLYTIGGGCRKHSGSSSWSRYTVRIWSLWCCRGILRTNSRECCYPHTFWRCSRNSPYYQRILWYCLRIWRGTYNQNKISCCIWFSLRLREWCRIHHTCCLHLHSSCQHWWRICKQTNSGLWILRRRQRSRHIWNNFDCWGTYPSKHRLYSSSRRYRSIQLHWRIYFCLQNHRNYHWWYCNTIWFCRRIVYLGRRRTDTTLQNCWGWRNCSQLCIWLLWRRQGSWYIWSGNNFWYWRYQKNPSIRILRRRQRSWNFRKTSTFFHDSCSSICRLHSISRWFWSIQDYWRSRNSPSFPTSTGDWIPLRYRIGRRGLCKIYLRRYRKYHNRDVHTNNHRTCTI